MAEKMPLKIFPGKPELHSLAKNGHSEACRGIERLNIIFVGFQNLPRAIDLIVDISVKIRIRGGCVCECLWMGACKNGFPAVTEAPPVLISKQAFFL